MPRNLYKRKRPTRSNQDTIRDVLRLSPAQFKQFKGLSNHYLGKSTFHPDIPKQPKAKLLRGSLQTISDAHNTSILATLMSHELAAHNDPDLDFNKGGGLVETASSIFNGLWNTIGLGPEFADWFDFFDYKSADNSMSERDKIVATMIQETYKTEGERTEELGEFTLDKGMSNDEFGVWVDENDREVEITLRGTKMNVSDILSDLSIVFTNEAGHDEEIVDFLDNVIEKFGDYEMNVSAHSLGGNEIMSVLEDNDFDEINNVRLFNPGLTPTHNLSAAKDAVQNDKVHFFLNSGDMISNTFQSLLPSDRENVHWSKATHNPLTNHGMSQWVDDD